MAGGGWGRAVVGSEATPRVTGSPSRQRREELCGQTCALGRCPWSQGRWGQQGAGLVASRPGQAWGLFEARGSSEQRQGRGGRDGGSGNGAGTADPRLGMQNEGGLGVGREGTHALRFHPGPVVGQEGASSSGQGWGLPPAWGPQME